MHSREMGTIDKTSSPVHVLNVFVESIRSIHQY